MYNGTNSYSFSNYLNTISYNQFKVHNIFPQDDGTKITSLTIPYNRSDFIGSYTDYNIIYQAIEKINYHGSQTIDYNNDGYVDNITIIVNSASDSSGNTLYPHRKQYECTNKIVNIYVSNYNLINTGRLMDILSGGSGANKI